MHYFQFNIGDYQSHTSHLTEMEDLAFRRMLDWCYLHEKALPADQAEIARIIRMRSHSGSIATVLQEFFELTADGWMNHRVKQEVERYSQKSEKARQSAKARWDANALRTQSEGNANHKPITINQEPSLIEAKASLSGRSVPPCPQQELLALWKKNFPHLAQPRVWEGTRVATMKARWLQASRPSAYSEEGYATVEEGLGWWDSFFDYVAKHTKLSDGFESKGRIWRPDLCWVLNATNFQKIIDGKYDK